MNTDHDIQKRFQYVRILYSTHTSWKLKPYFVNRIQKISTTTRQSFYHFHVYSWVSLCYSYWYHPCPVRHVKIAHILTNIIIFRTATDRTADTYSLVFRSFRAHFVCSFESVHIRKCSWPDLKLIAELSPVDVSRAKSRVVVHRLSKFSVAVDKIYWRIKR